MIEDYWIKSRVGRSEGTGTYEYTRLGTRREKSRYVERYVTQAGTFLPEEWKKRAKAAIEAEGELALLERVKDHCREHCAWLHTESDLEEYAIDCTCGRIYRHWKDFENTETIIWM